ncbi:Tetratricopeptide-like helical protein [Neofusicoccum parvum]|uniref:Tetratricopeptide-like helical protein n=1 Tax=Neofusicoccum parvum TaxID=310453 RepID=A0ACB5SMZ4_9PEZI|nr:Tetratricopeptide-like helical protein [Neofusicoccum parvum]
MTSHAKLRQEKEKKVTALVAFATSLSNRLHRLFSDPDPPDSTPDDRPLADLKPALTTHLVGTFPLPPSSALVAKREPLDRLATEIWNHATRLGRQQEAERAVDKRTLCLVRGFAVLALDAAAGGEKDGGSEEVEKGVRIMRVALKAARCWVEAGKAEETGLMRVLECAAGWEGRLKEAGGGDVDAVEVVGRLRAEYWMLRTVHAWKQSRLDLAEHMFLKSELESSRLAPDIADMLTDTLFEIGKDLFDKRQYEDAVKWLDRAFTAIEQRNLEELDHDAVELRLATLNFLVRAYLRVGDPDSKQKARKIVNLLELEHDHKIVVQLLKLDVLSADSELDIEQYYAVVVRMIGLMVFTDSAFKTIMHHVHKIKSKNIELAGKALDKLLHTRLFTHANKQWIEKVVVTQVWIYVDSDDDQPSNLLRDLLDVKVLEKYDYAMRLGAATRADLAAKRAQLLRYELESALKRNDWDGLDALWDECFDVQDTNSTHAGDIGGKAKDKGGNWYIHHLETLADLALVIHAELTKADTTNLENGSSTSTHRARILGVLQRIVNQSWQGGGERGADVVHLARWIRCLFQLSLDGGAGAAAVDQDAIPLQCVEQASDVITSVGIASVASSSTSSGRRASSGDAAPVGANAYPQNEADWLASTAFNRGVDFFCAGDDARCQRWVERALQLAKAAERGGGVRGLHGVLQEKYKGLLRWEED